MNFTNDKPYERGPLADILSDTRRKVARLSVREVAERIRRSPQDVNDFGVGRRVPDLDYLLLFSAEFGLDYEVLCDLLPAQRKATEAYHQHVHWVFADPGFKPRLMRGDKFLSEEEMATWNDTLSHNNKEQAG